MLDSNLKQQLKTHLERISRPVELVADLDTSPASATMLALLEDLVALSGQISLRTRTAIGGEAAGGSDGSLAGRRRNAGIAGAVVPGEPGGRRHGYPLRWRSDRPRIHLAGSGAASRRRSPSQDHAGNRAAHRDARQGPGLRSLHLAQLPQLPGRRPGAEPDGGAEPPRPQHDDRWGGIPAAGRVEEDHGRASRLPERPAIRPGQDDGRGNPGEDRHQRCGPRSGDARRQGAVRRAGGRRRASRGFRGHLCRTQGHSHRRRGRTFRRPGPGHDGNRELHLRDAHRGTQARCRARGACQDLRRGRDEPAARHATPAGGRERPPDRESRERRESAQPRRRACDRRPLA